MSQQISYLSPDPTNQSQIALFKSSVFSKFVVDVGRNRKITYLEGVSEHPGQQVIHFPKPQDRWQNFVAVWGRRTGKTIAAAMEVVAQMGISNSRVWIVAPTYELTDRVFEYVWEALVIQRIYGPDSVVKSAKALNNRYIQLSNGSFVKGKSGESPDSLIGEQLDLLVLDEAARLNESVWTEQLRPTLVDRKGKALFISTPQGHNWYREYYLRGMDEESRSNGWRSLRLGTKDNPFIDNDWLEQERSHTPETTWRQEYEASFEHRTGLIWPEFDENIHLYDPTDPEYKLNADYTYYRAIDVGYRHPTACVWLAVDREHNVLVFQEYLEQDLDHETHAHNINALTVHPIGTTWISPDSKRHNALTSSREDQLSAWDIYKRSGIYARPASNEVGPGLATVARYLRASREKNPSHPKVLISNQCKQLINGILNYTYHEITQQKDLDPPDKPRKYRDDMADALRYGLATRPRFRLPERFEMDTSYDHPARNTHMSTTQSVRINY
jgi:hypothetical protein